MTATAVRRLEITFDAAAESIRQKVEALPAERLGTPWHRAQIQLLVDIRTVTEALGKDYVTLLEAGMVELAQNAADREAAAAGVVNAPKDAALAPEFDHAFRLTNGQEIGVRFGRMAFGAVERVATRYYSDGLQLSDRIHRLTERSRVLLEDTITRGIIEGTSARDLAKQIRVVLAEASGDGLPPPRHVAMRIARTEIRHSHSEAFVQSTQSSPGVLKDFISGLRWNLSMSHKDPDQCDWYASRDTGAGPGIYFPHEFPMSHPNCLCFGTSVLKAFPESGAGGKVPRPDEAPPSARRAFEQEFPPQEVLVPA